MKRIAMDFFTDLQSHYKQMVQDDGYIQKQKGGLFEAVDTHGNDQTIELHSASFIQDHDELIEVRFMNKDLDREYQLKPSNGQWFLRSRQETIQVIVQ